jgi:hypothetical protein
VETKALAMKKSLLNFLYNVDRAIA